MTEEQEEVWDRLKYGVPTEYLQSVVHYVGNGIDVNFHSNWQPVANDQVMMRVLVNGIAQSIFKDFDMHMGVVVFKVAPANRELIRIEIYG